MEQKTTTKTRNLTEGSPWRLLFLFALPLMVGNIFQQMYTVVDTAVVGKVLGVNALAALGSIDWLNWMMTSIVQGFTQGFAILMAQRFGAGEHTKLRHVVSHSIVLAVLLAIVLTLASQGLAKIVIYDLLGTPEEIREMSLAYMRVMYSAVPIVMAYNLSAAILRSLGNSRTPLMAMVIASLTNIVLDLLFVPVLGFGVAGAAVATVLAQICSALYCLHHIRRIEILRLHREDWSADPALAGHLMRIGLPMALQNSIISIGGMIVQSVVNGFGVIFLAGYTATNKLYGILEIAAISYGYAMTTYAGQNLGAGKLKRISQGIRAGILIATLTSLVIMAFMIVFGRAILSLFISADPEMAQQVLQIAYRYLVIMAVCLPLLYLIHVMRSYVQGLGNTVLPMVSGIAEFVVRTGGAFLLPALLGENGILFVEIFAWLGADLILVPSYFMTMRSIRRRFAAGTK
jgi:putative MATE family efflux protein